MRIKVYVNWDNEEILTEKEYQQVIEENYNDLVDDEVFFEDYKDEVFGHGISNVFTLINNFRNNDYNYFNELIDTWETFCHDHANEQVEADYIEQFLEIDE